MSDSLIQMASHVCIDQGAASLAQPENSQMRDTDLIDHMEEPGCCFSTFSFRDWSLPRRVSSYTPISATWGISLLGSNSSRTLCAETRGIRKIVVGGGCFTPIRVIHFTPSSAENDNSGCGFAGSQSHRPTGSTSETTLKLSCFLRSNSNQPEVSPSSGYQLDLKSPSFASSVPRYPGRS